MSEFKDLIHGMLTFHYDQALAKNLEEYEAAVIGDLGNFKPIGILSLPGVTPLAPGDADTR